MGRLGIRTADSGFADGDKTLDHRRNAGGVFCAGTAMGPMSIAEAIASGEQAAWKTVQYLKL
jgi:heterodisulfide reductase subunit A-like polyferredoxin